MDTSAEHPERTTWNSTANVSLTDGIPSMYSNSTQAAIDGSLLIIIGILGAFGNSIVCVAASLSKRLQDTTHVFVVNLALSDFIMALALPFQGVSVLLKSESGWPFSEGLCILTGVISTLTIPTSILTLAAIAVHRCIIITKSKQWQQKIYTRRGVAIMVAFMWLFPFLVLVTPQLIPATGGIRYDPLRRICRWDLEHPRVMLFQIIASVIYICCTIVIIFCYITIFVHIRRHVQATRDTLRASTENININQETSPVGLNKIQIAITKNLAIVIAVFFICVLPYSFSLDTNNYSIYFLVILTLSTCLNPIIYAVRHPSFKAVFKCMFSCRFHDIPQQSEWLKTILRRRNMAI